MKSASVTMVWPVTSLGGKGSAADVANLDALIAGVELPSVNFDAELSNDGVYLFSRRLWDPGALVFECDSDDAQYRFVRKSSVDKTGRRTIRFKDVKGLTVETAVLLLEGRGYAVALHVEVSVETVADLVMVEKLCFDPGVERLFEGKLLTDPQVLAAADTKQGFFNYPPVGVGDPAVNTQMVPWSSDRPPTLARYAFMMIEVVSSSLLYDSLTSDLPHEGHYSSDLLTKIFYKEMSVEYDSNFVSIVYPRDINAISGLTIAVWSSNVLVLGLDRFENLAERTLQIVATGAIVLAAAEYSNTVDQALRRLRSRLRTVRKGEEGADLSSVGEIRKILVNLAAIKLYFVDVVRGVVRGSAAFGGRPIRSLMAALAQQMDLEHSEAWTRDRLQETIELLDIHKGILDIDSQASQLGTMARLLSGSSALRLVAIVFAVIATMLSVGSLWTSTLAVPSDPAERFGSMIDAVAYPVLLLGSGGLLGSALWVGSHSDSITIVKRTRALSLAFGLQISTVGLSLLSILSDGNWVEYLSVVAAVGAMVSAMILLSKWVGTVEDGDSAEEVVA